MCHSSTHPVSNVADQLGIPFEVVDISQDFKKTVVDYFTRAYQDGKTPNRLRVAECGVRNENFLSSMLYAFEPLAQTPILSGIAPGRA